MEPTEQSATARDAQLREAGDRIDNLLDALGAGGPVARERAEDLVRQVSDLYGAGIERIITVLQGSGHLDDNAIAALAGDDLVSALLVIHGLHPQDVSTRVAGALDSVRPYLGSHGGDVELLGVDDGVVRLRLLGSCDGCPSSSVTLKLAVETAIETAAPEVTSIEVEETAGEPSSLISVDALRSRLDDPPTAGTWTAVPEMADVPAGDVAGFSVAGVPVLVCRIGSDLFAFRDRCAHCTSSLAGATLERRMGSPTGHGVLRCRSCRAHFDVRQAGASVEVEGEHLEPFPVLVRDQVPEVAVPAGTDAGVSP